MRREDIFKDPEVGRVQCDTMTQRLAGIQSVCLDARVWGVGSVAETIRWEGAGRALYFGVRSLDSFL